MQFTVYQDSNGLWRWRLQANNNAIIADSGQGYTSKRRCIGGLNLVRDHATTTYAIEYGKPNQKF